MDFKAAKTEPLTLSDLNRLPSLFSLIAGKQSPPFSLSITRSIAGANANTEIFWVDGGHFSTVSHAHQVNPLIQTLLKTADKHISALSVEQSLFEMNA